VPCLAAVSGRALVTGNVSCHLDERVANLWDLVFRTLKPKATESPQECLNRLVRERISDKKLIVDETTATIREEIWPTSELKRLKRKHDRMNDKDDRRPIVVVRYNSELLLVDGNHRVNRWLSNSPIPEHDVLLIAIGAP
jgi:hypothetical protein